MLCDTRSGSGLPAEAQPTVAPVRAHGLLNEIPEAGGTDHVCWVYADDDAFDHALRQFLAGGLQRGDRLLCVGERVIDSLRAHPLPFDGVDGLVARGALETLTRAQAYEATAEFLPDEQLAFYEAATRRALDDGYRGLRVVAEVSALAADPARLPELVRWEHLADEYIASGAGFSAMCAYRAGLGPEALTDVASVHPLAHAPDGIPSFRVFFDGNRIALAGSVDALEADRLAQVLAASPVGPPVAVLDLGHLEFADVAACRVLARWARDLGTYSGSVEVTGSSPLLRRVWHLLALDEVAPVTFTGSRA